MCERVNGCVVDARASLCPSHVCLPRWHRPLSLPSCPSCTPPPPPPPHFLCGHSCTRSHAHSLTCTRTRMHARRVVPRPCAQRCCSNASQAACVSSSNGSSQVEATGGARGSSRSSSSSSRTSSKGGGKHVSAPECLGTAALVGGFTDAEPPKRVIRALWLMTTGVDRDRVALYPELDASTCQIVAILFDYVAVADRTSVRTIHCKKQNCLKQACTSTPTYVSRTSQVRTYTYIRVRTVNPVISQLTTGQLLHQQSMRTL